MVHVGNHHFKLVVGVHPGHQAALQHLRQSADAGFEILETLWCMSVHSDQNVGRKAQAQQFAVEQCYLAADVAVILKLFNTA